MTKSKSIILMLAILVMASCGNKNHRAADADELDDDAIDDTELEFKTYEYDKQLGITHVILNADYPVEGPKRLVDSIRAYISESLGQTYTGSLNKGKEVVDYYGKQDFKEMRELEASYADDDTVDELYKKSTVKLNEQTDAYITYRIDTDLYEGGAHGIYLISYTTLSTASGRRFGFDMFRNTASADFQELLRDGLKRYFVEADEQESISDDELKDYLVAADDIYHLELPKARPWIDADGVHFIYQPYEIAYFAAGLPEFTVAFNDIEPFLTKEGRRFIQTVAE